MIDVNDINNFSGIIEIIVIILIFGGERCYEYYFKKKELRKEWYYKIFIDPNLVKIEDFFESAKENFQKSQKHLEANSKKMSHSDFVREATVVKGEFQKMKRRFEKEVISPISFSNKDISEELTKILQDLEDFYTENVDKVESKKENSFDNTLVIAKIKVYQELFKPINN